MTALCKISGRLSVPLYITRYPFLYLYVNWIATGPSTPAIVAVATGALIFVLRFAWAALKLWDEPIRAWLKRAPG